MHYSSHAFQAWQKPSASGPCPAGCHARPLRRSMLRQTGLPRAAFTASEKIRRARPALQKNMMRRGKRRSATSRSGKKAGKENNPPRFPKIRPAPSRSVGAAKIRRRPPLLQSPAHSLAAPTRRACDANPRTAQIRPSLLRKAEVAASLPAGPLGEIPGRSAPAQPPLSERLRRTTPPR